MKHIGIIAIMIVLLTGCAGAAGIQSSLQGRSGELVYLHDSEKIAEKQGGTMKLASFVVDDVLPPITTVRHESSFVLPLLVFNMWKYGYKSNLGAAQIGNDYKSFIRESFVEELKRSGKFAYADDKADLEIDLRVKTIAMDAPIYEQGHFIAAGYFFAWGRYTSAGPVDVIVTAEAICKRDGQELFSREVQGRGRAGVLQGKNLQLGEYTTTMIEALSMAVKGFNETVVREVNKF
jgi:hypothetical protein